MKERIVDVRRLGNRKGVVNEIKKRIDRRNMTGGRTLIIKRIRMIQRMENHHSRYKGDGLRVN